MNFYKHHIGDYAQATAHLSFVEDAAYSRLLRKYYAEERPIPADLKAAQRLVGARSKEEREAVQTVLEEFFELQEDGWHNKRADEELSKAQAQAETNRRIAEEREARKRARMANAGGTNRARNGNESLHDPGAHDHGSDGNFRHSEPSAEKFFSGGQKTNGSKNFPVSHCKIKKVTHESLHESLHESFASREPSHKPLATSQTPDESEKQESAIADSSPAGPVTVVDSKDEPEEVGTPPCPVQRIVATYNRLLPELPAVRVFPEQAARMLRARWREDRERQSLAWWEGFFAYVRTCPFLMGRVTNFQADLLWLVRPTNFAKVLNGNYEQGGVA